MINDPFAEPSDNERTIIRPRPGGVAPASRTPAAEPASAVPVPHEARPVPRVGTNPLVAAAAPVLAAAVRIAGERGQGPNPERLRQAMVDAIRTFETKALETGLDTRSLRAARYALCATIDDLVLSTPWGSSSSWVQQSMTSIFHNEVIGGDRFFEIMEQMQQDLGHHAEVVELMYLCTSLGFEGRYRVMPRGVAALTELRDGVYRTIRQRRGDFERELSPHWRGTTAGARPLSQRVPLWALGLGTFTLAMLMYVVFTFLLANESDVAFAELHGLPPHGQIVVPRRQPLPAALPAVPAASHAPATPAPPPAPAPASMLVQHLRGFLAPEIKAGLVEVMENAQTVTVRLAGRTMFGSGEATLATSYRSLLQRIGEALEAEKGRILVNGYTDNQPIRTARFPSNFELSQARADAVGALLVQKLSNPKRLRAQGKADADPIASNASPEGRQQNRRTEIVLVHDADAP